mgnify:CR=1 FL=1
MTPNTGSLACMRRTQSSTSRWASAEKLNVIKKWNRGSIDNVELVELLKGELPDVFIYLLDLATSLGIDLHSATAAKREELVRRWGEPKVLSARTP